MAGGLLFWKETTVKYFMHGRVTGLREHLRSMYGVVWMRARPGKSACKSLVMDSELSLPEWHISKENFICTGQIIVHQNRSCSYPTARTRGIHFQLHTG